MLIHRAFKTPLQLTICRNHFVEGCSAASMGLWSSFDIELSQLLSSTTENVPADDPLE